MNENINDNWHYADKGKVIGPISFDEIKQLIANGTIKEETSVWSGQGDWKPAKETSLNDLFAAAKPDPIQPSAPPPLYGSDINNKYVWLLVAVPFVGIFADLLTGSKSVWIFAIILFALNTIFYIQDKRGLKALGHSVPSNRWIKIIPVYLWQRAIFLKQKNYYFWGWIATLVLSIALISELHSTDLESSACPLVTQILHEQLGENSAECKIVKIDQKVSDNFYKATAVLDNGNELPITIEEKDGDRILVRVPNN